MKKLLISSAVFLAFPFIAFAQVTGSFNNIANLVHAAANIIGSVIPILIAIAMIVFFWGLIQYIRGAGGEKGHEQGKNIMIAGLVSLFVMVCVWGIVIFAANALGVQAGSTAPAPGIPGYSSSGGVTSNGPY